MEPAASRRLAPAIVYDFRGDGHLTQSDPTDHALATIASLLDRPDSDRGPEKPAGDDTAATLVPADADGYSKLGPGPMVSIRFKWTVRHGENEDYFVDETIGENSIAIASGPMSREAAIRLVDDREREAHQRFEELKSEMSSREAATDLERNSSDEL
jgi:hypothetical protein